MNLRLRIERLERQEFGLGGAEAETTQSRQLRVEERSRNQFRLALQAPSSATSRPCAVTDDTAAHEWLEAWHRLDPEVRDEVRHATRILLEREQARQARGR